jgi:uridine kinase
MLSGFSNRDIAGVLEQYSRHVKPSFDHYIAPSMVEADIIVPRGGENQVRMTTLGLDDIFSGRAASFF